MNKHFDKIEGSDWLTKADRDNFARFCKVYKQNVSPCYGLFDWEDEEFKHFCKSNKIQQKGTKAKNNQENHFWFTAEKLKNEKINDIAFHFFRHIRNAFAHGNIELKNIGKKNNKYFVIEDWKTKKEDNTSQLTMRGVIRSNLFWEMMWILYKSKSKI